jgi:dTDP-L-rhamnose 4-epimerase
VVNVGSGASRTIEEVARTIATVMRRPDLTPEITRKYRMGDVRHCFADITLAREVLEYAPEVDFADGIKNLAGWLGGQVARDRAPEASAELEARGLTL